MAAGRGREGRGSGRRARRGAAALFLAAAAIVLALSILNPLVVEGPSMFPTFEQGDLVFLFRLAYGLRAGGRFVLSWSEPRRGDLVVLRSPSIGATAVKRVAATGGDPLAVSGLELSYPGGSAALTPAQAFHFMGLEAVPGGELLLLGDNPSASEDSREYGCVPVAAVLGKVVGSIRRR